MLGNVGATICVPSRAAIKSSRACRPCA